MSCGEKLLAFFTNLRPNSPYPTRVPLGSLRSAPRKTFIIQIFSSEPVTQGGPGLDPSGFGESEEFTG